MKKELQIHKVRIIQSGGGSLTYGVTIPSSLNHWVGVYVKIRESGGTLILQSGAVPSAFTLHEMRPNIKVIDKIKI